MAWSRRIRCPWPEVRSISVTKTLGVVLAKSEGQISSSNAPPPPSRKLPSLCQDPKNPGNGKPRNPHWEVPQKDSERSSGGCARRSSVMDYHLQEESLLGSKPSSIRKEMEGDMWGDMKKVTRSLRANLENSSKFVAHFSCVKPQFGRAFWNREFSRNLVRIRGFPSNPEGNADHPSPCENCCEWVCWHIKTAKCFTASNGAHAQGNQSCQNTENFWEFLISNSRVSGFQGFLVPDCGPLLDAG